ncbi:nucleotidyl transferase AbiEii/AbiGii toxin family protein [Paraburkholderia bonniea]|uniref:nucleotidyl transferase AbiEii/AbiGii toxin family protein n=1 Tax=Paraburkholderia bonniea TaxID=2152891 RepID=UPI001580613D|nr:nucleotidyl transferase AbiEii/AbiGii toxin family protein [Paraburkholderia bonniea]WJF88971.1 nucleotidyl transferase AbiEii/AbiGii toxin family protein [Paraburkholderia bonniea]WJF92287.1 nucleotidyl transferase AbiEii/AbiGii toxin family protein [Paraburkholderia bonniea]
MNPAFQAVITATDAERRDLFLGAATRLGTAVQNVEKDFWVCWTLDALFNGLAAGGPRLLFKGGTSLSKAFGLISRFSEDIDITVFRTDLGQEVEVAELRALSGKKRRARLEAIRDACQTYIAGPLSAQFTRLAASVIPEDRFRLELDPSDKDAQSLLFWYPSVTATTGDYIRSAIKIEAGAKSALDPHTAAFVAPYVTQDLPELDLNVTNVMTVKPERTFWDKIMILHGLRQWHDCRGELRHGGQRVSRHYYDVHQLLQAASAATWLTDYRLAIDCADHASMFFGSADLRLDLAAPGTFTLAPSQGMRDALERDYDAMAGMVFGDVPRFDAVLESAKRFEQSVNGAAMSLLATAGIRRS